MNTAVCDPPAEVAATDTPAGAAPEAAPPPSGLDVLLRPPEVVPPEWRLRPLDRYITREPGKYGLEAKLLLYACGDQTVVSRCPDRTDELTRAPLSAAVAERLDGLESAARVRRLQTQIAEASKALAVAEARKDELLSMRRRLVLEVPSGLAAKLAKIDAELLQLQPTIQQTERDLATLRPEEVQARHDAETAVAQLVHEEAQALLQRLTDQRAEVLQRLLEAVSGPLTELGTGESARSAVFLVERDAKQAALAKLAEGAAPAE